MGILLPKQNLVCAFFLVVVVVDDDDLRVWTGSALLLLAFPVYPQVSKVAPKAQQI